MIRRLCSAVLMLMLMIGSWAFGTIRANWRWRAQYEKSGFVSHDVKHNNDFVKEHIVIDAKFVLGKDLRVVDQVGGWLPADSKTCAQDMFLVVRCRVKEPGGIVWMLRAQLTHAGCVINEDMNLLGNSALNYLDDTVYYVTKVVCYRPPAGYGSYSNLLQTTPCLDIVALGAK